MPRNDEKMFEVIKESASKFIQYESNQTSLITVTNVTMSKDFKKCDIFVTVLPEDQEENVIVFLKRKRKLFKEYMKKSTRLNRIPFVNFEIDKGEKSRQRIDEISQSL
jgi:ribosome-binding factor A